MTSIYDAELLLVDDNPDLLRLLCEQLSGAGYHHIRTAATCAAARAAFDAAPPHLMVLDIKTCRTATVFRCSGRCGPERMSRRCSSPHGMPMQTGCSGWALAQTII